MAVSSQVRSKMMGVGPTAALSTAIAPMKQRRPNHDRGEVLVDVAVLPADGDETISPWIDELRIDDDKLRLYTLQLSVPPVPVAVTLFIDGDG